MNELLKLKTMQSNALNMKETRDYLQYISTSRYSFVCPECGEITTEGEYTNATAETPRAICLHCHYSKLDKVITFRRKSARHQHKGTDLLLHCLEVANRMVYTQTPDIFPDPFVLETVRDSIFRAYVLVENYTRKEEV